MNSFECNKCGACCRTIRRSEYGRELDRGDGICKYLTDDNLCTIYDRRPFFCNVDAYYDKFFADKMSRREYYEMNHEICAELKRRVEGRKCSLG